ncbi:TetR/AcrR family transcriptional regulator [Niallia sp. NCCP-28]|uniref:TetR/AcrR family transcriptional regulator n=1 Tax=Niallia sp. NCCP-28 TaxID=2934712 RepID=UPI00208A18B7|nr:TetR/AcrR family transcriptional regulator [Niallia sp. NCCP-28]GKU83053.1 TetR family transcriptional regulator [Niallia sp. NCCP-28]
MNGFEKRAAAINEKIIRNTIELLKTSDPNRIRIGDIAKAANVSQVTIYNYFGSKEELLEKAIQYYLNQSMDRYLEYMNGDYTIKEKINKLIQHEHESYHTLSPDWLQQIFIEDDKLSLSMEKEYREKILPPLLRLIEDGKKSGEISDKISSDAFLLYLNMLIKQYKEIIDTAKMSKDTDIIESLIHIFFYGVFGKE